MARQLLCILGLSMAIAPMAWGQMTSQDSITQRTDSVARLQEVVVTGKQPQVTTRGGVTIVRVAGSLLAQMGSVSEMLAITPGLHRGSKGIEVGSLGVPIFVLRGKEVDPNKVLDLLQAKTIKEVRIDRNPSSVYSKDGRPVVEIVPLRPASDYLSLSVGHMSTWRRLYGGAGNLDLGWQVGKWSSTLNYLGGEQRGKMEETYFRRIHTPSQINSYDQERVPMSRLRGHRLIWRNDLYLNPRHYLGFEYYFSHSKPSADEGGADRLVSMGRRSESAILRETKETTNLHSLALQYNYKGEGWSLQGVQDYASSHASSHLASYVTSSRGMSWGEPTRTDSHREHQVATTTLDLKGKLPAGIDMSVGAKYIFVRSDGSNVLTLPPASGAMPRIVDSDVTEHNPQTYISLSRHFGALKATVGLRYEYLWRSVGSQPSGGSRLEVRRHSSALYPSLRLNYESSRGISAYMRYGRSTYQPNFSDINSGLIYEDAYTLKDGNPDLRASTTDRLSLGISWRGFSFDARYRYTALPIVEVSEQTNPTSDVVVRRFTNLTYDSALDLELSYSNEIGKLNLYASGELSLPRSKYPYLGETHRASKPSVYFNANLSYPLTKWLNAYTSMWYQGSRERDILYQRSVNSWRIGLSAALLGQKLLINLAFTDLLDGAHYNNLTNRYGNIEWGTRGVNDMRGLTFKVNYRIFSKKIRTRVSRANYDALQRL